MKPLKKVMISQRMKDMPDDEIKKNRQKLIEYAEKELCPDGKVEIVDSYFEDYPDSTVTNKPVWYLGKAIQKLSEADILLVEDGAEDARGCKIEIAVAEAYGIEVVYA